MKPPLNQSPAGAPSEALAEVARLEAELAAAKRRLDATSSSNPVCPDAEQTDAERTDRAFFVDSREAAAFVAAMPIPAWVKDDQGRHRVANPAFYRACNVTEGSVLGLTFEELGLKPEEVAELRRHDDMVRATGEPFCGVERLTEPTGERRAWHVTKFAVPSGAAQSPLWGGFAADITDAFEYEEQLEMGLEAGGVGTWSWTPKNRSGEEGENAADEGELLIGPRCWRMLGHEPQAGPASRKAWRNRVHPDDRPRYLDAIAGLLCGEVSHVREEIRLQHADGSYRWIDSVGKAVRIDASGRPLKLVGLHLDIHRRKTAETALQRQNVQLRDEVSLGADRLEESEERFVLMAHSSPLMLWITHESGDRVWLNPELEAFLGADLHENAGRRVLSDWIAGLDRDAREGPAATLEREVAVDGADGLTKWLLLHGRARHTRSGRFLGHVGTVLDVTEQHQARAALELSKAELERAVVEKTAELQRRVDELASRNRELDHFAHVASHDLRSPLRTITGFSGFLAPVVAGDPEATDLLERIQRASLRMATLLDSLLAFASVGRGEFEARPVDLEVVFAEVLEDLAEDMESRSAQVHMQPLPVVSGDETMLRQAFQNLLANALKYAGPQPPRIRVHADLLDNQRCHVTVADGGIGFPASAAEQLFTPFRRFHQEEAPGSGVGLSIVKRISERHGGRVWAERLENDDYPTRFHMELRTHQA